MTPKEVAEAMETAYGAGDWATLSRYLGDNFVYDMPGNPLGKEQVVFFAQIMRTAFPDVSYNLHDFSEDGNTVRAKQQMTGTHTGTLDLSFMGMPPITPTGKAVTLPEENLTYTIEGDKIAKIQTVSTGETGLPVILKQLGIEMPGFPQS